MPGSMQDEEMKTDQVSSGSKMQGQTKAPHQISDNLATEESKSGHAGPPRASTESTKGGI